MPTPPVQNDPSRRKNRRTGLRCMATLILPGREPQQAVTSDIAVDGLSFHFGRPVSPGTRCKISFELPLRGRGVPIDAQIKTVYSSYCGAEGFRIGAVFTGLDANCSAALLDFTAPDS